MDHAGVGGALIWGFSLAWPLWEPHHMLECPTARSHASAAGSGQVRSRTKLAPAGHCQLISFNLDNSVRKVLLFSPFYR